MPAARLSMRKVREILRLKFGLGLGARDIARSRCIPRSSVANYLKRAKDAGLGWPLPADLGDELLESFLFSAPLPSAERPRLTLPDFQSIHEELRRNKHVTLQLLWHEYRENHPEGYQYSRFC